MTNKELQEELKKFDDDMEVLTRDARNPFNLLDLKRIDRTITTPKDKPFGDIEVIVLEVFKC